MRRISRKTRRREVSCSRTIETIPEDLLIEILARLASSSIKDMVNAKLSCKLLKRIAEDPRVYRHASLHKFPVKAWKTTSKEQQIFFNKCREYENPELPYREALVDVFDGEGIPSTTENLEKAIKLTHLGSLYLTCIVCVFSGNETWKAMGIKMIGSMKKSENLRKKMRSCRNNLMENIRTMWVRNPIFRNRPVCCSMRDSHLPRMRNNPWIDDSDDEDETIIKCEACSVDNDVKFFCDRINVV